MKHIEMMKHNKHADVCRMLKHTVNKVSSLRDFSDDDNFVIANTMTTNHRHCEERSDEAIHKKTSLLDCFAALANTSSTESMTDAFVSLVPHFQFSIRLD